MSSDALSPALSLPRHSLFSSSEEAVLSRELDKEYCSTLNRDDSFDMDISGTAQHIVHGCYRRVALQFPDVELVHAEAVLHKLQEAIPPPERQLCDDRQLHTKEVELFVLCDTSFDGFQVDFVAAQHLNADLIVHYGDADLEAEGPIDVRFVFGRRPITIAPLATEIKNRFAPEHQVLVVPSLSYSHICDELIESLGPSRPRLTVAFADVERHAVASQVAHQPPLAVQTDPARGVHPATNPTEACSTELQSAALDASGRLLGRRLSSPIDQAGLSSSEMSLVYVGDEDQFLSSLCVLLPRASIFVYTPASLGIAAQDVDDARDCTAASSVVTGPLLASPTHPVNGSESLLRRLELGTAKRMMRRYYLVQQARDAAVIGILIGTLSAACRKKIA